MKRIIKYFKGKSVKQRIAIGIILVAVLTLLIFTIKANFFDVPPETAETQESEPQFHINLVDVGILLTTLVVYSIHKIREKRKQGRL